MDVIDDLAVKPLKEFTKDSIRLLKRCTKPDRKGALPGVHIHSAAACSCSCTLLWPPLRTHAAS